MLSNAITEGEKKDLESNILELEVQKSIVSKQVEEIETLDSSLEKHLKMANEKHPNITPFHCQAYLMHTKIHQVQLKMVEEVFKIKQIEARLKEIEDRSLDFMKEFSEVTELVQSQVTWIGANSVFPKHMPQKTAGELQMELALLNFSNSKIEQGN